MRRTIPQMNLRGMAIARAKWFPSASISMMFLQDLIGEEIASVFRSSGDRNNPTLAAGGPASRASAGPDQIAP
jgi:hypothetical protein